MQIHPDDKNQRIEIQKKRPAGYLDIQGNHSQQAAERNGKQFRLIITAGVCAGESQSGNKRDAGYIQWLPDHTEK